MGKNVKQAKVSSLNLYSGEVYLCATAYVKAENEAAAKAILASLNGYSPTILDHAADVPVCGYQFDDPRLPAISLSPAMMLMNQASSHLELQDEGVPGDTAVAFKDAGAKQTVVDPADLIEALGKLWAFTTKLVERHGMNGDNTMTDADHAGWQDAGGGANASLNGVPYEKPTLAIICDGGLVQDIVSDKPGAFANVMVIDYDTQGADEEELTKIPQSDGSESDAIANLRSIESDAIGLREVVRRLRE